MTCFIRKKRGLCGKFVLVFSLIMIIILLLLITLVGVFFLVLPGLDKKQLKSIALYTSICTLFVSLIIFAFYHSGFMALVIINFSLCYNTT